MMPHCGTAAIPPMALSLSNPGFEQALGNGQPADWSVETVLSDTAVALDTTQVHSGQNSLRIQNDCSLSAAVHSPRLPTTAGA